MIILGKKLQQFPPPSHLPRPFFFHKIPTTASENNISAREDSIVENGRNYKKQQSADRLVKIP